MISHLELISSISVSPSGNGMQLRRERRAGIGAVGGVIGAGKKESGLTVAASGTRRSGGRAADKDAAYGVSPLLESSIISIGSRVPVPESC